MHTQIKTLNFERKGFKIYVEEIYSEDKPINMDPKLEKPAQNKEFGQWFSNELNDVPVAFTHECDITGSNSSSPVMNARGELAGIAFDGNYEALTMDWRYNTALQRTISVDIRYVLFITEQFAGVDYLLREMGTN